MSEKIAVLGAGPMGLAVAYELIKNGKKPTIIINTYLKSTSGEYK